MMKARIVSIGNSKGIRIPKPLLEQLSRTGKLVIPIGAEGNQRLARVMRVGTRVQIEDCGTSEFVPLVGKFGWKE